MMESLRELADNEEALLELSSDVDVLLEKWERLVIDGKREQQPNHLEIIKTHLGEFPDVKSFAKKGGMGLRVYQPHSISGVAYEIRPGTFDGPDGRRYVENR